MEISEDWNIPTMPIFLIMWGKFKNNKTRSTHTNKNKQPPTKQTKIPNKKTSSKIKQTPPNNNKTKQKPQTPTTFLYEFTVRLPQQGL